MMATGNGADPGENRRAVQDSFGVVGVKSDLLPVVDAQGAVLLPAAWPDRYGGGEIGKGVSAEVPDSLSRVARRRRQPTGAWEAYNF